MICHLCALALLISSTFLLVGLVILSVGELNAASFVFFFSLPSGPFVGLPFGCCSVETDVGGGCAGNAAGESCGCAGWVSCLVICCGTKGELGGCCS